MNDFKYNLFHRNLVIISLYENTLHNKITELDYENSIHFVGLFYYYLYDKHDKQIKMQEFFKKYLNYFLNDKNESDEIVNDIYNICNNTNFKN
jgi:hypothetical protein